MIAANKILLTGGTGRLGREITLLLPDIVAPHRTELDVTNPDSIERALDEYRPDLVVHAAAFTNVAVAETDRETCWTTNVRGTVNIVKAVASANIPLVYISTDYVFEGSRGAYREDEPVGPVRNYYALSKLAAEEVVRVLSSHLVIRTSFRPRNWPYATAFTDVFTSQDYVDVIAPKVALAIQHYDEIPFQTLHIGTERKSVFELARRRKPDVRPASKRSVSVALPDDVSLDISRWERLEEMFRKESGGT